MLKPCLYKGVKHIYGMLFAVLIRFMCVIEGFDVLVFKCFVVGLWG